VAKLATIHSNPRPTNKPDLVPIGRLTRGSTITTPRDEETFKKRSDIATRPAILKQIYARKRWTVELFESKESESG
jgi:hypothetical protein